MRNIEQRISAVHRRRADLQRRQRQRWIGGTAAVLCLLLAVAFSLSVSQMQPEGIFADTGHMASLFAQSGTLGYAVVAVLSFLLGVTATLFCLLLGKKQSREDP